MSGDSHTFVCDHAGVRISLFFIHLSYKLKGGEKADHIFFFQKKRKQDPEAVIRIIEVRNKPSSFLS